MIHTWNRLKLFILRASKVIVAAVFILTVLNTAGTDGSFGNENSDKSVLASMGKAITPVFGPMGVRADNWPASVSIFTGLFAKEAVVGTLNTLYGQKDKSANEPAADNGAEHTAAVEPFSMTKGLLDAWNTVPANLSGVAGALTDPLGTGILENAADSAAMAEKMEVDTAAFERMRSYFTVKQAYAFLLFILLYFPCVAALGAMFRETGIKLAAVEAAYLTILAWIAATLFYQLTEGHSVFWIAAASVLTGLLVLALYLMGKYNVGNIREDV